MNENSQKSVSQYYTNRISYESKKDSLSSLIIVFNNSSVIRVFGDFLHLQGLL